jgi:DNA-binding transcriptional ArsR family regulator
MSYKAIMVDEVFTALADETRRHLLEHLATSGRASASRLALDMPISRQAIAKHLKILESAGLVSRERHGRQVEFEVDVQELAAIGRWMQRIAQRWDDGRRSMSS